MTKLCLVSLLIGLAAIGQAEPAPPGVAPTAEAITTVLKRQQRHWNAGDIEGFVQDYWQSPELTFSSGGTTRRGFRATRERYLQAYPTPAKMGKLVFSDLEVTPLGESAAMVLGRWQLVRQADGVDETLGGNFTLVMRLVAGRWVIVHDHTSRTPAPTPANKMPPKP